MQHTHKDRCIAACSLLLGLALGITLGTSMRQASHHLSAALRLEEKPVMITRRGAVFVVMQNSPSALHQAANEEEVSSAPFQEEVSSSSIAYSSTEVHSSSSEVESATSESSIMSSYAPYSTAASQSTHSAVSSIERETVDDSFPAFGRTLMPVEKAPDWGNMHNAAQWNRTYNQMNASDFVSVPRYRMSELTYPVARIAMDRTAEHNRILTSKLFYSTRFFGSYDLDSEEFTAVHPGVDLKLPEGTPVGSIAGGRVEQVLNEQSDLGLHVIVEHHIGDDIYFSIYGHLSDVLVAEGQIVEPGQTIGKVGNTGFSMAPHLHLQIDRDTGTRPHQVYWPSKVPSSKEAQKYVRNPIPFILEHSDGE